MATRLSPSDLEVIKLGYASEENLEIFVIDNLTDTDRRKPIVNFLENPTISTQKKLRFRALSYTLMGNKLFKKTPEEIFLKCLIKSEAYLAMSNVHSGACGAHQVFH